MSLVGQQVLNMIDLRKRYTFEYKMSDSSASESLSKQTSLFLRVYLVEIGLETAISLSTSSHFFTLTETAAEHHITKSASLGCIRFFPSILGKEFKTWELPIGYLLHPEMWNDAGPVFQGSLHHTRSPQSINKCGIRALILGKAITARESFPASRCISLGLGVISRLNNWFRKENMRSSADREERITNVFLWRRRREK